MDDIDFIYKEESDSIEIIGNGTTLPRGLPRVIEGIFQCDHNKLTTLKGCPSSIGGSLYCHYNKLTTLEFCASYIGKSLICSVNNLTSLTGCPSNLQSLHCDNNELSSLEGVPDNNVDMFVCSYNKITSLEFCPRNSKIFQCEKNSITSLNDIHYMVNSVSRLFDVSGNPIKSHILGLMMIEIGGQIITRLGNGINVDLILNKWKNQGRRGVMGAMKELSDLGYDDYAQL